MDVSQKSIVMVPSWLAGGVLALAAGVLPLGVVYAQEFEAVERRLGAAVAEGELSLAQAQVMMSALRATSKLGEVERLQSRLEGRMRAQGELLRTQVAAGEISKEEAKIQYKAAEREMLSYYQDVVMRNDQAGDRDEHKPDDNEPSEHEHGEHEHGEHEYGEHARDGDEIEQLRNSIEEHLWHHREDLRSQMLEGKISREDMEREYEAKQQKMWGTLRKAEMDRERDKMGRGKHVEHQENELHDLRRGIEARIRRHGEQLRKQFAAGEVSREKMEEAYEAAETKMWGYYRQAELRTQQKQDEGHDEAGRREARGAVKRREG